MPQSASEQEGPVECSIVQNDHKVPISESESSGAQFNKEADTPHIQNATEFNAVSDL